MDQKTIAVLLNYKNFDDTVEGADSLLKQTVPLYKIMIVDNCSKDGSYEKLCQYYYQHPIVEVIISDYNGGFGYGNNFGMKYCFKKYTFDNFLLINNDTRSDERMLEVFHQSWDRLKKKNNPGILCGKIYYYYKPDIIWSAGGRYSVVRLCGYHYGLDQKDCAEFNVERKITFATGCLLFFKKELIKEVGYLAEDYFMYVEDLEFSYKTIKKGFDIFYIPQAMIWHKINSTELLKNNKVDFYYPNRNRIVFGRKNYNLWERVLGYSFLLSTRGLRFLEYLSKGVLNNTFKGIIAGFTHPIRKDLYE